MPTPNLINPYGAPAQGSGLAGEAAAANIAASGDIEKLSRLAAQTNEMAWNAAPGRKEQLAGIQNRLAGNLDPQTIESAQLDAAQQYGSKGFGVDSGAWQSAIQRAIGTNREAIKSQGATELDQYYSGMPTTSAQQFMMTPELLETQQQHKAQNALAAQQLAEQSRQFNLSTAEGHSQFLASLEQRKMEAMMQAGQAASDLQEKIREYNITHDTQVAQEIARLQENARQANQIAALEQQKLTMAQSQFTQKLAVDQSQFGQQYGLEQAKFGEGIRQYDVSLTNQQKQFEKTLKNNRLVADLTADKQNYWDPRWTAFKSGGSNLPGSTYATGPFLGDSNKWLNPVQWP
jgi:hypothetical protein